jgi:hypothetical protein
MRWCLTRPKRPNACEELAADKSNQVVADAAVHEIESLQKVAERLTAMIDRKEAKISEEQ